MALSGSLRAACWAGFGIVGAGLGAGAGAGMTIWLSILVGVGGVGRSEETYLLRYRSHISDWRVLTRKVSVTAIVVVVINVEVVIHVEGINLERRRLRTHLI